MVFTHDLDFRAILAATQAEAPSVLQLRASDVLPGTIGHLVVNTIRKFESELQQGALISLDIDDSRIRLLPLPEARR